MSFPLTPGQTCTLGRAATNRIVLKDDLCSREHAEVSADEGRWRVRDLNSLNGTRVNGDRRRGRIASWSPNDEVQLGRTRLRLRRGHEPAARSAASGRAARRRLHQETPGPDALPDAGRRPWPPTTRRPRPGRRRATLSAATCRCSTGWPSTWARPRTTRSCAGIVLDALLEAIPAEVGAILTVADGEPPRNAPAPIQRNPGGGRQVIARGRAGSDGPPSPRPEHPFLQPRVGVRQQRGAGQPRGDPGGGRGPRPPPAQPREPVRDWAPPA